MGEAAEWRYINKKETLSMSNILRIFIAPTVRAVLQVFGGAGIATDNNVNQVVGAVTVLATIVWSIYEKQKSDRKLADARGNPTS